MKNTIIYDDFAKLDIRVGRISEVSVPEGSKKLLRCVVDFGEEIGTKVIFSGVKEFFNPEDLVGKQACYVINLEPRPMMGELSEGMLLAAAPIQEDGKRACVLVSPEQDVVNGTSLS